MTLKEKPYVMYKDKETEERQPKCGVEHFVGFCIDLLLAIAKDLGIKYDLCLVPDQIYGEELENGTWTGILGQLVRQVHSSLECRWKNIFICIYICFFIDKVDEIM